MRLTLAELEEVHKKAEESLSKIVPGERVVYFRGHPGQWSQTMSARALFAVARRLYEAKLLMLTQRRVPNTNSVFEYIATGCGAPSALSQKPKARVTVRRGGPPPVDMPAEL